MRSELWFLFLFITPLLLGPGCRRTAEPGKAAGMQEAPVQVRTVQAEARTIEPAIHTYGHVAPRRVTEVTAAVQGVAKELPLKVGAVVSQGDLLVLLASLDLQIRRRAAAAGLSSAEAALELARSTLAEGERSCAAHLLQLDKLKLQLRQKAREAERAEEQLERRGNLLAMEGISTEEYAAAQTASEKAATARAVLEKELRIAEVGYRESDLRAAGYPVPSAASERRRLAVRLNTRTLRARVKAAEAGLQAARSELEAAELLCTKLSVSAPSSGLLARRPVEEGELIRAHDRIASLYELQQVFIICRIPEHQAAAICEGMQAAVRIPALEERELLGRVFSVAPAVESPSGNIGVKILVDNSAMELKPGMFARVKIVSGPEREAVLLPETALLKRSDGTAAAYLLREGRIFIRKTEVRPGPSGTAEIISGVREGETVVDAPSPLLQEGQEARSE
jgi:RND family efflux transporter MFP subunit